jgi:L-lactate dehydrogenase complex protein LldG
MTGSSAAGGPGGARAEVLARIRQGNAAAARDPGRPQAPEPQPPEPQPPEPQQSDYRTAGERSRAELLDLLTDRLTDYKATVRRTTAAGLAAEVAAALAGRGARRVVVPSGLDLAVLARADAEAVVDGQPGAAESAVLSAAALDELDGVVTGAAVAVAETGTIVLDGSPGQGRRAITLVPDYHLCIVRADQVVELVPEAVTRLSGTADRPLTWISGPSATSDIELERVEGVHGPRTLVVILVED